MGLERQILPHQGIERTIQLPAGGLGRTLQLERPCRRIARVGERSLADVLAFPVQPFERTQRHKNLAPYLELRRISFAREPQRHGPNRPDIGRHVVAPGPVAPGHGSRQTAVLVGQTDGRAVEFQFAYIFGLPYLLTDPGIELAYFVHRISVRERQHRVAVLDGLESVGRIGTDPLRGRIGVGEFGMGLLEPLQFPHQLVEFVIADRRVVQYVITIIMVVDLPSQLFDFLSHISGYLS